MSHCYILVAAAAIFYVILTFKRRMWNTRSRGLPLPPSLKGLPIIGNVFNIPTNFEWEVYKGWSKRLGSDIVSANAMGFSIVVLNKRKLAIDFLEGQSAITSSRVVAPMSCELMGWNFILPLVPYGEEFRCKRRMFQQNFHRGNMSLRSGVNQNLPQMLTRILKNPEDFRNTNSLFMAGTILKVTYGVEDSEDVKYYLKLLEEALAPIIRAAIPGRYLVDIFPFLKYVPRWLPGAGFKHDAEEARQLAEKFANEPLADALNRMTSGNGSPSFISDAFTRAESDGVVGDKTLELIRDIASSAYSAGTETTLSSLDYFYLAMAMYPEVQKKAQKELDTYLKGERLPEFEDKPNLPYIWAIVKEVLRWQPVIPVGVPHMSTEDTVFNGYFIPKNSIIIANQWAMLKDEEDYPEPETFKPERFLTSESQHNESVVDPQTIAFGFGRRICPGAHMATSTLFITAASMLSLFEIKNPEDFNPERQVRLGIARSPTEFRCEIRPRVQNADTLIEAFALHHTT
ncbi:cytochrome P450, partial [Coprinopsis marcescibilis]